MSDTLFSRLENVTTISDGGLTLHYAATPEELARLAEHFGLRAVEALVVQLKVERWRKRGVRARGQVAFRIVQNCVVTLEPVSQSVEEEVDWTFLPHKAGGSGLSEQEILIDFEGDDPPASFDGRSIDFGPLIVEQLALSIDPYPRLPDATFDAGDIETEAMSDALPDSPFASLRALKEKNE